MIGSGTISAVHVGAIQRLENAGRGGRRISTAFIKSPMAGPVAVGPLGLAGDIQANRRFHGGPEKAVYGYPIAGYAGWRAEFPEIADRFGPGAMGENLVVTGPDETTMCIGDIVRCGLATLQISQFREPCSTLAAVLGSPRVVRAMARSGRCGWYYRVVESGTVSAGDPHIVIDRPNPDWSVARFAAFAIAKAPPRVDLAAVMALSGLAPALAQQARQLYAVVSGTPAIQ